MEAPMFTQEQEETLRRACESGDINELKGALPNDPFELVGGFARPTHWAAAAGHANSLGLLLELGYDFRGDDEMGNSALASAAMHGHSESVLLLLAAGAPIDQLTEDGNTALMLATMGEFGECVATLIERGANTKLSNYQGLTAAELAHASGNYRLACFIEQMSASRDERLAIATLIEGGQKDGGQGPRL